MSRKSRKNPQSEILTCIIGRIRRAGVYVRLSNFNAGKADDDSIETQTEYLKQSLVRYTDITIEDIYADNGFTGRNFERPQFERLLSDIRSKRIDCVVVKDFSRLGRNFVETGYYIEKLFPFLDIRFISINDNYDSEDPHSRGSLTVPIKDMLNDYYSKDISRKVSGTFEIKRQKGENIHVVPYGYKKDSKNLSKLAIDEATVDYVRMIFKAYSCGQSISKITKKLNEIEAILPYWRRKQLGLTRPSDKVKRTHWITTDVVQILDNPVYTGDMVYNRLSYPNGYKKTPTVNPKSEWQVVTDSHPAIISRKIYKQAENRLKEYHSLWNERQNDRKKRKTESPNYFGGILFCTSCGENMTVRKRKFGDGRLYQHFYCVNPKCGHRVNIAERLLQILIMDNIRQNSIPSESLKYQENPQQEIAELNKRISECKMKKRTLYENMIEGRMEKEQYLTEKETINQVECELAQQLSECSGQKLTDTVEKTESLFSPELLSRMIQRIDIISDTKMKITYKSEVSK